MDSKRSGMRYIERIGDNDSTYMTRVHLTPWRWWPFVTRLYLHIFWRPDDDRDTHDHPFAFRSTVLWGGYDETVAEPGQTLSRTDEYGNVLVRAQTILNRRGWLTTKWVPATFRHTISRLHTTPTITLVARGPKTRDWGFWPEGVDREQFVPWHIYLNCAPEPPAYGATA